MTRRSMVTLVSGYRDWALRPMLIGLPGVLVAVATGVTVVVLTVALTTEAVFPPGLPGSVAARQSVRSERPSHVGAARWTLGEMSAGLRQSWGR